MSSVLTTSNNDLSPMDLTQHPNTPSSPTESEHSSKAVEIEPELLARVAALQRTAFLGLGQQDWPFLAQTARLLQLRDQAPAVCAGEAAVLMCDKSAPRCWRARAAVYRAEALMRLGFGAEARRALTSAGRMLSDWSDIHTKFEAEERRESYQTLEALVAWNVSMGKLNWGMVDGEEEEDIEEPIRSGPFFAAGWPLSHSLSALDLKWC
ncbi:uncharacterized protein MELLADRAFT_71348 [Melampsora larici-populina 98AG31]|uniref:Uncharacterized protein n=1 Tax=Melampsora larici-populina (strain 98AG31 / pathotype 3-4-7) TaxID=747676 RepID=F4RFL4_MELLP|nr:uncharacterized protein MELLADRAFT_71348 [Melampsora larici-populina 98AG31]EGG08827.1 hypothetical protein MELLADRAFT_71348 [Melampsora larici-populina 98AG31]